MNVTIIGNFKFLCLNEVFNNSTQAWLKGLTDLGPLGRKTFQTQSKKLPSLSWSYLCDVACVWLYSEPYKERTQSKLEVSEAPALCFFKAAILWAILVIDFDIKWRKHWIILRIPFLKERNSGTIYFPLLWPRKTHPSMGKQTESVRRPSEIAQLECRTWSHQVPW